MDQPTVEMAVAAAQRVASSVGLPVEDVIVAHNSNKLTLRLLPSNVIARVAHVGKEVAALEIDLAQQLAALQAPVAALHPRFEPRVYHDGGFAITWWTFYETAAPDRVAPEATAVALHRLHDGLRRVDASTPHFLDRVEEAERLVADPLSTPELDDAGRALLLTTFSAARDAIARQNPVEQLLHGEPHPGNILGTTNGPLFIDFETCCRGPIEFDVAHVPPAVAECYAGLDQDLLQQCRRLVLAMVAAWRWDVLDEFPDRLRHGRAILTLLRDGPPWPTINEFDNA